MKRWVLAGLVVAVAAGAAVSWRLAAREPAPAVGAVLGIDELMRNVYRYREPVRIEGVVLAVAADGGGVSLIDRREFERCGTTCPELVLPVRWHGRMPAARDLVRVEGEVEEVDGKLIFVARAVEGR